MVLRSDTLFAFLRKFGRLISRHMHSIDSKENSILVSSSIIALMVNTKKITIQILNLQITSSESVVLICSSKITNASSMYRHENAIIENDIRLSLVLQKPQTPSLA